MDSQCCSQDFLTRNPHTCTVNPLSKSTRDREHATTHETRSLTSRRAPEWRDVFLLVLAAMCLLHVQSVGATNPEFNCKAGEKLSRFEGCTCGEYARIVPHEELQAWEIERIFTRRHGRNNIPESYVCIQCTQCGDGIRIELQCKQRSDTACSPDACADPTWKFDFGSKSCRPLKPVVQPSTTTVRAPTTTRTPVHRSSRKDDDVPEEGGGRNAEPNLGTSSWLWRHMEVIIIGLIAAVTLLLVLIIAIMFLIIQIKGKQEKIARQGTPFSSQNTSNSSVNV